MITIKLSKAQYRALCSSFDSAERGREDFEYLVRRNDGDYDAADIRRARAWHSKEIAVETLIRNLVPTLKSHTVSQP